MDIYINYWAVIVSAIVSMIVGSIWFGPLFGKDYMKAMGMNDWSEDKKRAMQKSMTLAYIWQFIGSLVMFYVLARFVGGMYQMTVGGGLMVAFWVWLGFIVPLKLGDMLWGGKKILFWLSIGNSFITLLIAGAILGGWH